MGMLYTLLLLIAVELANLATTLKKKLRMKPSTVYLAVLTLATCAAFLEWRRFEYAGEVPVMMTEYSTFYDCTSIHDGQHRCVKPWGHLGFHKAPAPDADVPSNWFWDDGTVERCTSRTLEGEPCWGPLGHNGRHYEEKYGSPREGT